MVVIMSFGAVVSTRKPRSSDYILLAPKAWATIDIAGIDFSITNHRESPVYLKWKI